MYNPEMRKDCPMRGNLGNCSPVGGFCMDAVSDEICEAVHNAYYHGFRDAKKMLKKQEAVEPINSYGTFRCGNCKNIVGYNDGYGRGYQNNYCSECGKAVKWDD